jgi:hypothetical protein
MSLGRWTATALVMTGTAWALAVLGPGADQVRQVVTAPQLLVDTAGPDALLVPVAAAAGWLCWGWGALGLLLTVASALPGAGGRAADLALGVLLPAGARRLAALAVGLTLGTGLPAAVPAAPVTHGPALAAVDVPVDIPVDIPVDVPVDVPVEGPVEGPVPDRTGGAPPDWPGAPVDPPPGAVEPPRQGLPAAEDRVVLRGDCLWDIAAEWLAAQRSTTPREVDDADVLAAVRAWWQANVEVIGPDPDLLLPGQVLSPPAA